MEDLKIKVDDLKSGDVIELLMEHHAEMHLYSPPESIHALDIEKMKDPDIQFWSAWCHGMLAGCGALKEIAPEHGEIKSMRTAKSFQRQGVAEKILQCILEEAKSRNYQRVSLETGSHAAFQPAIRLYRKNGFSETDPFGSYKPDPHSVFLTRLLNRHP